MTTNNYRQKDIKKSKFVATTTPLVSDYMDLVRSGQNLKVTIADLATVFGASGPLQTRGESTGTEVLTVIADVNYIRNLIDGPGIVTTLSPQDGIKIGQGFNVDKTGVAIMINETALTPTFRSIQAGTGISVGGSGDVIQISTSGTPGSTKTIQVFQESDFPTPVAGTITLADNTEYLLLNDVSTANRFIMGAGSVLGGADATTISLTYTGAATMITSANKTIKIKDLTLSATSGTLFACSNGGANNMTMFNCILIAASLGTIDGFSILTMDTINGLAVTQGLILANNFRIARFNYFGVAMAAGTGDGLNLGTATFDSITLDSCYFNMNTSGYCLTGLASSGNINSGGLGAVTNCRNFGTADLLGPNLSPYDNLWIMTGNAEVPNSRNTGLARNTGTTVNIITASTPVLIGAGWVPLEAYRFTITAAGRFTYTGKGATLGVTATISADIPSGIDNVTFYVALNGTVIANSAITREIDSGNIGNVGLVWSLDLDTNDYLEFWVQNDDTNVDIIISNAVVRIL